MKKIFVIVLSLASSLGYASQKSSNMVGGYILTNHALVRMQERNVTKVDLNNLLRDGKRYANTPNTQLVANPNAAIGAVIQTQDKLIITVMRQFTAQRLNAKLKKIQNTDTVVLNQKDIKYLKHTAVIASTEKSRQKN
ncbi:hypothetical protein Noda2021_05530 [Candidatus Dependentiae bacterium Noda2021]|nr:hypothetical protein Noda2021_05530 [Candidatus Dependentiae bacterium Noda2021]